jgi:DNA-binding transcriptional LysR family regulator
MTSARAGLGLAVLPCIMASHEPELVRVPTDSPAPSRELWLLFHRDIGRSPAVRAVINRITEITTAARKAFLGE